MKHRILLAIIGAVVSIAIVFMAVLTVLVRIETRQLSDGPAGLPRAYLLSDEEISESVLDFKDRVAAETIFENGILARTGKAAQIDLTVKESGQYNIVIAYGSPGLNLFENRVDVTVGDISLTAQFPFLWADDISDERTDRYGNEIIPGHYQVGTAYNYIEDFTDFSGTAFVFDLKAGRCRISIEPHNQEMKIFGVYAVNSESIPSYEEYSNSLQNDEHYDGEIIIIEGEDYRAKSDSYIRSRNIPDPALHPFDPYVKLLNATDEKSNKTIGQKIIYEVDIPRDGIYDMTFVYSQPLKIGGQSYRTIEIDGKVPFSELRDVGFSHTGIEKYSLHTVGGDYPTGIYLSEGKHTIALKVTAGPLTDVYNDLLKITEEINDLGIKLKKIRGSNSGSDLATDANRTWDILQYVPDILETLEEWESALNRIYDEIKGISQAEPAYASDLMLAAQNIKRLRSIPREIPNRMTLLSDDSSSAAQLISLVLTDLYDQSLSVERIYLHAKGDRIPGVRSNVFRNMVNSGKQFIYSFSDIMNESVDVKNDEGILTVWVNKPVQYVEVMRETAAADFTEKTGIEVVFSVMPDEKKITLANSTGSNPDLALGLSYYRPAEFAMRGMAVDLLQFEDFLDWYSEEYNLRSLAPMAYEDGIYAASETQDFYCLFYRKDILDMLGLEVPDTWEDVKSMMPVLHRNAMNFNLTLANNVGYKSFEVTGGFIFQNGGDYYSKDGFGANFNDPNTLKGLREMVDLYRIYGLAQNIPNFFNVFRSGSVPIGVSNFSTYLQLQQGAPELSGRWDIALVPGTIQADGKISRYWSADATAAMIFSNTKNLNDSYRFLKWWLSSETQLNYATDLQLKYGPDYIWNTANHKALEGMSYPKQHKDVILEQWSWQREAIRHPASYILEREVSNAWIAIVTQGEGFQARIDEGILNTNREIKRKLTEFGYYDQAGNKVKDYNVTLIEDLIRELGSEAK